MNDLAQREDFAPLIAVEAYALTIRPRVWDAPTIISAHRTKEAARAAMAATVLPLPAIYKMRLTLEL